MNKMGNMQLSMLKDSKRCVKGSSSRNGIRYILRSTVIAILNYVATSWESRYVIYSSIFVKNWVETERPLIDVK